MKSEDYVKGTTQVWRKLIDEKRNATPGEIKTLGELFSRQGFTDGYYKAKIDSSMLGVRTQENKDATKSQADIKTELKKPTLDMYAEFYLGEKSRLTIKTEEKEITVYGDLVEKAQNAPISQEDIIKNLSKLGQTPFSLGKIQVLKSDNVMVRVSRINALRRQAIEKYFEPSNILAPKEYQRPRLKAPKLIKTAVFREEAQIPKNADYFDIVFLPIDKYTSPSRANGIILPPVVFDSEWKEIEKLMSDARASGIEWALISNVGQIERAKNHGFKLIADYRFNAFNAPCVDFLVKNGVENVILAPELSLARVRDFKGYSLISYGCIPAMTTHKCVLKDTVGCQKCEGYMTDRQGARLFVDGIYGHRNLIYNSVPVYMADKSADISDFSSHFIFSWEKREECERIIEAYKTKKAPNGTFRRIK